MPDRKRGKGGEWTEKINGRKIVTVFKEETERVTSSLSTTEIHDGLEEYFDVEVSRQTVRRRLNGLEENGIVEAERDGSRVIYWRLTSRVK